METSHVVSVVEVDQKVYVMGCMDLASYVKNEQDVIESDPSDDHAFDNNDVDGICCCYRIIIIIIISSE